MSFINNKVSDVKIKGAVLHARIDFVREHFGDKAWEKVVSVLPADAQAMLNNTLLSSKWYPFSLGERLDWAIVVELGSGDMKVFEKIGVKSAQRNLTKDHKTFLVPGDPQAFMKKAGSIYKFYYDTGYREYEQTGPNSGVLTTYDAETFSVPDCLTVIGWYKEALRMCGARDINIVEETCRAKGGSFCRYRVEWVFD
jgi:hypothetical protein